MFREPLRTEQTDTRASVVCSHLAASLSLGGVCGQTHAAWRISLDISVRGETLLRQKDEVAGAPEGREVGHHFTDVLAPLSYTPTVLGEAGGDAESCV